MKELDLSGRQLSDEIICSLAQALIDGATPSLRKLKLQKNRAETRAAAKVAEFIEAARLPLSEVHLSHNYLNPQGVELLLTAAAKRREYPLGGRSALWLRIEQQQCWELWHGFDGSDRERMQKANDVLRIAEAKVVEIQRDLGFIPSGLADGQLGPLICHVVSMKQQCNPSKCSHWHTYGPVVHVTYFWQQGRTFANLAKREGPRQEPNVAMNSGWGSYGSRWGEPGADWTGKDWAENANGWHNKENHNQDYRYGTAWQWNWKDQGEKGEAAVDEEDDDALLRELEVLLCGENCIRSRLPEEPAWPTCGTIATPGVEEVSWSPEDNGSQRWPAWSEVEALIGENVRDVDVEVS
eukprot:TRINITY_DN87215_c0_g1_i1.p1 TRINITY_DN87215_c0_g1~~TRINITY_DN87215_c0_g1_i1.p1  ORF type:complete len:353 (-),score=70.46 TRINITY_DN87215_c0_g1_i1:163-1221(-)